jgi:inhibitor of cysteine peptidase
MTKTLTAVDNGTAIELQPGDELIVRLDENPTTGYRWEIDRLDGPLEPIADSYEMSAPGTIGGGGSHEFRFRAASPGTAHLTLKHLRSWEGDASITQRFSVSISVAG